MHGVLVWRGATVNFVRTPRRGLEIIIGFSEFQNLNRPRIERLKMAKLPDILLKTLN